MAATVLKNFKLFFFDTYYSNVLGLNRIRNSVGVYFCLSGLKNYVPIFQLTKIMYVCVIVIGGACGYGSMVDVKPLRARVGAVSPILFKGGEGCGACYKVRCLDKSICSRRAVTVIITDECPGGYCSGGRTHFDLSGAAFGRMAISGEHGQLRNRGEISVMYRR